jgi:hypothetical protein
VNVSILVSFAPKVESDNGLGHIKNYIILAIRDVTPHVYIFLCGSVNESLVLAKFTLMYP